MSTARDASFRQCVRDALGVIGDDFRTVPEFTNKLAKEVLDQVHRRGLAIHDPANCVRVPWQERGKPQPDEELGRPMTLAEQVRVGLIVPSDDIPADA